MLKFDINILWTLINLIIFFVLMKLFLFKPIKKTLDKRKELIEGQFKAAEDKEKKPMSFRLNISHSSPALKMKRSKFWLKQEIMPRLNMTKLLPVQIQMQQKSRQMPKKHRT